MRTLVAIATLALSSTAAAADSAAAAIQKALELQSTPTSVPYIFVERKGPEVRGVIAEIIPMKADHVLNHVIMCYGDFPDWFPLQTQARYISEAIENNSAVIYGELAFPWPIGKRDFEAIIEGSYEGSGYRIDFDHKPGTGNIKVMHGHWLIQPHGDDSALVVYDSTADFDTWVPGFLLARGTEQFLPGIMQRMRKRTMQCTSGAPPGGLPKLP